MAAGMTAGVILGQIPVLSTTPVRALATLLLLTAVFGSLFHVVAKLLDGRATYGRTLLAVLEGASIVFLACSALALAGRLLAAAVPAISAEAVNVVFHYPLAAYLLALYAAFAVRNAHQLAWPRAALFLLVALGLAGGALFLLTVNLLPWGLTEEPEARTRSFTLVPVEEPPAAATLPPGGTGSFEGAGGKLISYGVYDRLREHPTGENRVVVISSGRTENRHLYAETIDVLRQRGYTVYIHDHRGQGASGRLIRGDEARQRSHVGTFDDYVADLKTFVETVVKKTKPAPKLYLLAHSMGGGVAALYLERQSDPIFNAAALVTPMNGAEIPAKELLCALNELVPDEALGYYALGQRGFDPALRFEENDLTHSPVRHAGKSAVYAKANELAIGGVTHGWFRAACKAGPLTVKNAGKLNTPVLLFQAGGDTAVDNEAQEEFARNANGRVYGYLVPHAYHALLMEHDVYRRPVMEMIVRFFDRDGANPATC
ncbi:MAG TPA: alpha/beta fold hydrolase [Thermoanaerobaculia bacterium]